MVGVYNHLIPAPIVGVGQSDSTNERLRQLQERQLRLEVIGLVLSGISIAVAVYEITRRSRRR